MDANKYFILFKRIIVYGFLNTKSVLVISNRYVNLKHKYGIKKFFVKGIICRCSKKEWEGNNTIHKKVIIRKLYVINFHQRNL